MHCSLMIIMMMIIIIIMVIWLAKKAEKKKYCTKFIIKSNTDIWYTHTHLEINVSIISNMEKKYPYCLCAYWYQWHWLFRGLFVCFFLLPMCHQFNLPSKKNQKIKTKKTFDVPVNTYTRTDIHIIQIYLYVCGEKKKVTDPCCCCCCCCIWDLNLMMMI